MNTVLFCEVHHVVLIHLALLYYPYYPEINMFTNSTEILCILKDEFFGDLPEHAI